MNKISKELFLEKNNYVFSPISLYMALSMLLEGAANETQSELLVLLQDNDVNQIESKLNAIYNHNFYKNNNGIVRMANSIWAKYNLNVYDSYIQKLQDIYYAESYQSTFDDTGKENIAKWINNYTNNLLDIKKEDLNITEEIVLLLINTIYFNNKWLVEFKKENNSFDLFDKNINNVEYMKHMIKTTYNEGNNFTSVTDSFYNQNYIKYILPNEGVDVLDCLNNDILLANYDKTTYASVNLKVPKFKIISSYNLNEPLKKLGMVNSFNNNADFSKISEQMTRVSFVKQDAGIVLNEEGVEAAAVTIIENGVTSIMPLPTINFILNRPFIYVIYDVKNVPLFVGIVTDPTK